MKIQFSNHCPNECLIITASQHLLPSPYLYPEEGLQAGFLKEIHNSKQDQLLCLPFSHALSNWEKYFHYLYSLTPHPTPPHFSTEQKTGYCTVVATEKALQSGELDVTLATYIIR